MVHCCIDLSRGTAYGLLMAQIVFTIACILYSPHKEVTVYTLKTPTNTTDLSVHETHVHVQAFMACLSFLAFFFSMQTMNYSENEVSTIDYDDEFVQRSMLWNLMFWVYSLGAHLLLTGIILNTCDVYALLLSTAMQQYALYQLCLPRTNIGEPHMTRENLNMLSYVAGICIVYSNAQHPELILWLMALDYTLGLGHTWDKQATLDTIINCRLFYICCQSLLLCVYYTFVDVTKA